MPLPPDELAAFMGAIRALESGGGNPAGNYAAIGIETKYGHALGAYQIMEAWWDDWAAAAGYAGADWRDPRAQDAVAAYKMNQYYDKYGDLDLVSVAWFAGPGNADKAQRNGLQSLAGVNDTLTSVPDYVSTVRRYLKEAGVEAATRPTDAAITAEKRQLKGPTMAAPQSMGQAYITQPEGVGSPAVRTAHKVLNNLSQIVAENATDPGVSDLAAQAFKRLYKMREPLPKEEAKNNRLTKDATLGKVR